MPGRLRTARPRAQLRQGRNDWYRITNAIGPAPATIHVYDEIGYWGISASDFVAELSQLNVSAIDLHINSPGGEIFDGIAIMNALRAHPAVVTTYVDSLAASIASVIAMAGDRIVMAANSQMMIHDGSGMCIGDAADMRELADLLDRQSDNIAAVYADRAGGTVAEWRALMTAETWYTAAEAVEAGLADEVLSARSVTDGNSPENLANAWDLSIFTYAGRDVAPAPVIGRAPAEAPVPVAAEPVSPAPAPAAPPAAPEVLNEAAIPVPAPPEPAAPAPPVDPWAAATAHLTIAPSPDDAFARLTEALL
jgi:ATP-dependent protease ClpP protease subunit